MGNTEGVFGTNSVWKPVDTTHRQAIGLWEIGEHHKEEWYKYYPDKVLDMNSLIMFMEMLDEDFNSYCERCALEQHHVKEELEW